MSISLDGQWQLKCFNTEADALDSASPIETISAHVPGDVHLDLLHAGKINDPFWNTNADTCQWVSEKYWAYHRNFDLNADQADTPCDLIFEGLDTYATITLNGTELGKTSNMFIPHRFNVSKLLRLGQNKLTVRFTPPLEPTSDKDTTNYPAAFDSQRLFIRKMQCSFGWDWAPRILNIGIWRPVRLEFNTPAKINNTFIKTTSTNDSHAIIDIDIENTLPKTNGNKKNIQLKIEILDTDNNPISSKQTTAKQNQSLTLKIPNPHLWWPNGSGQQYLYTARLTLIDIDEPLDSKTYRFGIRTIEIEQTDDKRGSSFIFKINGKRRFIKGANWVPIDSFPASATASRYREILRLAKDANINMLRVWGGGVYESPNFYQACDELGIMIWQDFMFACGHYPDDDPQWLTNVQQELQHAFHSLRNHTSIVLWCGNNECGMNTPTDKNYPGKNLYEGFLKDLCQSDPTRPYRITSPYDGEDPNSPDQGDMHFGAWVESAIANEPENFSEYVTQRCTGRFHSEIHTMGSPPIRSLQRFMSEDDINDKYGPAWEFHTRNNPYDQCLQTYIQRMAAFYLAYYGPPTPTRLHTDMLAYQQHEIITQHTEHHRRAMFDCGGVLFWSMNEPWPCICGSLVDYYLAQKAGYFAAKRRFKPTIISIQRQPDQTSVWICNDLLEGFDAKVDFAAESFDGRQSIKRSAEFYINPNSANRVFDISPQDISTLDPTQCFLTASLTRAGKQIDRTITPINLPQQWNLPEASLTASTNQLTNDTIELTVSTDAFAQAVTIEPLGNYNTPQKLGA